MIPEPTWLVRLRSRCETKRQVDAVRYWGNLFRATPPWLSRQHKKQIRRIRRDARDRGLHVDHIVPLDGGIVCGLHVPWNLRAATPERNYAKSNRWWPDCPFEQTSLDFKPRQLEMPL